MVQLGAQLPRHGCLRVALLCERVEGVAFVPQLPVAAVDVDLSEVDAHAQIVLELWQDAIGRLLCGRGRLRRARDLRRQGARDARMHARLDAAHIDDLCHACIPTARAAGSGSRQGRALCPLLLELGRGLDVKLAALVLLPVLRLCAARRRRATRTAAARRLAGLAALAFELLVRFVAVIVLGRCSVVGVEDALLLQLGLGGGLLEAAVPQPHRVGPQLLLQRVDHALRVLANGRAASPAHLLEHLGAEALGMRLEGGKIAVQLFAGLGRRLLPPLLLRDATSCWPGWWWRRRGTLRLWLNPRLLGAGDKGQGFCSERPAIAFAAAAAAALSLPATANVAIVALRVAVTKYA